MFEIGQLTRLPLGYVGENGTRTISIDMKAWLDEYPGALIMIQVIRPVDHYKYPAAYTKTDGVIHWTVDGAEVMYAGKGLAQIALYNPDTKQEYKSRVVGTIVAESLDGFNDILLEETDPASKWVNQVLVAAESAETSKNDAANSKEEAAAAVAIVSTQKNEALIAIQNEGAAQVVSVNEAGAQQAQSVAEKGEEVLGKIPTDYTELINNVAALTEDIARNTAPAIIPTATGRIVTITDGAARPAAEVISHIEPVQDGSGDPSPDNVRAISGWNSVKAQRTGKNLWSLGDVVATYYTADVTKAFESLAPDKQYTLTWKYASNGTAGVQDQMIVYADAGGINIVNGISFTITEAQLRTIQAAYAYFGSDATSGSMTDIMLNEGSTAIAYEPYQGQTLTATLPETVYGGKLDWTTGVLTVEWVKQGLRAISTHASDGDVYSIFEFAQKGLLTGADNTLMCNCLRGYPSFTPGNIYANTDESGYFLLEDQSLNTIDKVNAYLTSVDAHIVYKLATPYTIQLTPQQLTTLKGVNNVWSSTGDTTLSYVADTKLYIDQKLAAIAAATL